MASAYLFVQLLIILKCLSTKTKEKTESFIKTVQLVFENRPKGFRTWMRRRASLNLLLLTCCYFMCILNQPILFVLYIFHFDSGVCHHSSQSCWELGWNYGSLHSINLTQLRFMKTTIFRAKYSWFNQLTFFSLIL